MVTKDLDRSGQIRQDAGPIHARLPVDSYYLRFAERQKSDMPNDDRIRERIIAFLYIHQTLNYSAADSYNEEGLMEHLILRKASRPYGDTGYDSVLKENFNKGKEALREALEAYVKKEKQEMLDTSRILQGLVGEGLVDRVVDGFGDPTGYILTQKGMQKGQNIMDEYDLEVLPLPAKLGRVEDK
ncbi:hypothetical protein M1329_01735 [Candidatus Marsarchaeota archaeon]|nr:hypothetical protein [Candidatus Marsarchaeota archaeon]MCL5099983.1 hypothetical protein [Candidatus Marsarchaeota archaeon]